MSSVIGRNAVVGANTLDAGARFIKYAPCTLHIEII